MTPRETLVECFVALPEENLRNLLYHERAKTPIACGNRSAHFVINGYA